MASNGMCTVKVRNGVRTEHEDRTYNYEEAINLTGKSD